MRTRLHLCICLVICLFISGCSYAVSGNESLNKEDIVILYTSDSRCAFDDGVTYAGIASYKKELLNQYQYVTLVDAGDYCSGGMIGAMSEGLTPVQIMNQAGYDVAALGGGEFNYGVDRLLQLQKNMDFTAVSCNFLDNETENSVFDAYEIKSYGDVRVAFLGITAPKTYNFRTERFYVNEKGTPIYQFCQDENGKRLYQQVQATVDQAKAEGVDYVIALSNLGQNDLHDKWDVYQLISHTTGIDAIIDGNTPEVIDQEIVRNKNGEKVILTKPGSKLSGIGEMTISEGKIETEIIKGYKKTDLDTNAYMAELIRVYKKKLTNTVLTLDFDLIMKKEKQEDEDGPDYLIRRQETNLGDLCADAYRTVLNADIADGAISFQDIMQIFPYYQQSCVIKATGQQILDALEMGSCQYPNEERHFLQVSGLTFEIDDSISSAVILDERVNIAYMSDQYRVRNVMAYNRDSGNYEPLDLNKYYTVALSGYMCKISGSGYIMLQGCELLLDEELTDSELLLEYLRREFNGALSADYANENGQGRIRNINK